MATALLVIDAQKVYTNRDSELFCPDSSATIRKINSLIGKFEKDGNPIVFVRHVHRADGSDLGRMFDYLGEAVEDFNFKEGSLEVEYDSRLSRPAGAIEVLKTRYSAFCQTGLKQRLLAKGVNRVVVCGFMTNCCCESTARDAHDNDFFVDFVTDATGTPGTDGLNERKIRSVVSEFMEAAFARVMTTRKCLSTDYAEVAV